MHFSKLTLDSFLFSGIHTVNIELSDEPNGDDYFAQCTNIAAGNCCALTNGDTKSFQSIRYWGLRQNQVVSVIFQYKKKELTGKKQSSSRLL